MEKHKIKNLPEEILPRERLLSGHTHELSDAELLAVLLDSGNRLHNVFDLSYYVLGELGGLEGLKDTTPERLLTLHGIGSGKAAVILAAVELSKRLHRHKLEQPCIHSSEDAAKILYSLVNQWQQEVGLALYLDTKQKILQRKLLFQGTTDRSIFHPRDIFREAVRHNASYVIVGHTHPSGSCIASEQDYKLTELLQNAGNLLDIPLLDHILLTENQGYISLLQSEYR